MLWCYTKNCITDSVEFPEHNRIVIWPLNTHFHCGISFWQLHHIQVAGNRGGWQSELLLIYGGTGPLMHMETINNPESIDRLPAETLRSPRLADLYNETGLTKVML